MSSIASGQGGADEPPLTIDQLDSIIRELQQTETSGGINPRTQDDATTTNEMDQHDVTETDATIKDPLESTTEQLEIDNKDIASPTVENEEKGEIVEEKEEDGDEREDNKEKENDEVNEIEIENEKEGEEKSPKENDKGKDDEKEAGTEEKEKTQKEEEHLNEEEEKEEDYDDKKEDDDDKEEDDAEQQEDEEEGEDEEREVDGTEDPAETDEQLLEGLAEEEKQEYALFYLFHAFFFTRKISQKTCPFFSKMRKAKHAKAKLIKKIYMNG